MNVRLNQDQKIKVLNSEDVWKVMQQILLRENKIRRNQEHFWVVGLDNENKILFIELVGLGAVNRVQISPPQVFRMAIYKMAVNMILVHNHPSGNLKPSDADIDMTDRLIKAGEMIEIKVIEHLIITEEDYSSFMNLGLIEQLQKSGKYELIDKEKAELTEWKLQTEREQGEKQKAAEIVKKLKKEGMNDDFIKKVTGLRKSDIKKL